MNRKYIALFKKDFLIGRKNFIMMTVIYAVLMLILVLVRLSMFYGNLAPYREDIEKDGFVVSMMLLSFVYINNYFMMNTFCTMLSANLLSDRKCGWTKFSKTLPISDKMTMRTKTGAVILSHLVIMPVVTAVGAGIMKLYGVLNIGSFITVSLFLMALSMYYSMTSMTVAVFIQSYNTAGMLSMLPMLPVVGFFMYHVRKIIAPYTGAESFDTDSAMDKIMAELKTAFIGFCEHWWWAVLLILIAVIAACHILAVKRLERRD